jgi:branched-chain amino acid transport system permease protein
VKRAVVGSRVHPAGVGQAVLFLALLVGLPLVLGQHWQLNLLIFTLMYAGLACAWNILGGFAGYPALGNGAFFGVGAYAMAIATPHLGVGAGYRPFALVLPIAIGTGLLFAPIGWLLLRTRAVVFALLSIKLLFMVQTFAYNLRGLTHGSQGISVPFAPFPAATFEIPFYAAMAMLLAVTVLISWVVRSSKLGLALNSVSDDEARARGLGVQTELVKLIAFGLSAGLTAAFGAIWAYYIIFVFPAFAFDPLLSLAIVLMAFLGGRGTLWGPVVGAALVVPTQQYLAYRLGASHLYLIGYAALLLFVIYLLPKGIVPSARGYLQRRRRADRVESTATEAALPDVVADKTA